MKDYEILPHTADLKIRAFGRDQKELFAHALKGMSSVILPELEEPENTANQKTAHETTHDIDVVSSDMTTLLIDFLSQALSASHAYKSVFREVKFKKLSETELKATLKGQQVDHFDKNIKAVTYHKAQVEKEPTGFMATIIYDV